MDRAGEPVEKSMMNMLFGQSLICAADGLLANQQKESTVVKLHRLLEVLP